MLSTLLSVRVLALDEEVDSLVLKSSPPALQVGKRVKIDGYSYWWPVFGEPVVYKAGAVFTPPELIEGERFSSNVENLIMSLTSERDLRTWICQP